MNLKEFVDPPKEYRPLPVWSWNSELEPSEIDAQGRDIVRKGFGGFIVHAGEGLKTSYMGDDWMKSVRRAIDLARELNVETWIHDEDRSPSGWAGGKLTGADEKHLAQALTWRADASAVDQEYRAFALAYTRRLPGGGHEIISEQPESLDGCGIFFRRRFARGQAEWNGEQYTDLLSSDTVAAYIAQIHARYNQQFPYDFGEHLRGMVTDHPTVARSLPLMPGDEADLWSFPWTEGFPAFFEKLHGYAPLPHLHHLLGTSDEGYRFRHDYWVAVNELFITVFTDPLSTWCHEHSMKFAGWFSGGARLNHMIPAGGSIMAHDEYLDIPGVENTRRRAGLIRAASEAASVAAQFNRPRTLGQVFNGMGHGVTAADMKREADLFFALGVTSIAPDRIAYSLLGERGQATPAISYHQPWWDRFKLLGDYIGRCSWAVSRGHSSASVLVMAPFRAAGALYDSASPDGGDSFAALEKSYEGILEALTARHIPFHIGDERILHRHGKVSGGALTIGYGDYTTVILPASPGWETTTYDLLDEFTGALIIAGEAPGHGDGFPSGRGTQLIARPSVITVANDPALVAQTVLEHSEPQVRVTGPDGSELSSVLVNHRIDAGAQVIFLANTDERDGATVTLSVKALGGAVELDPLTGRVYRYQSSTTEGVTSIVTTLAPSGSRIFVIDPTQTSVDIIPDQTTESALVIEGPYIFKETTENALVLDRCSLSVDARQLLTGAPLWKAKDAIWDETGLAAFRPIQPWVLKDRNIRSRTNTTQLTFTFTVRDIPEKIALALEQSDRFETRINGVKVEFSPGRWYIDRRSRVLHLDDHVIVGVNTITLSTDYLWDTELGTPVLFGDFALGSAAEGYPIIRRPEHLQCGSWTDQGYPFYAGSMTYTINFALTKEPGVRYELDLSGAAGMLSTVMVNGAEIGAIPFPPHRGDITSALRTGDNTLEVEVAGTLRNILGPHHLPEHTDDPDASPRFTGDAGWSEEYSVIPCGFLAPPKLIKVVRS